MMKSMIAICCAGFAFAANAQDFNYVPDWANTTNHRYKGDGDDGEWAAKTELFGVLAGMGPEAECTLRQLSEQDANVIVNRYRRQIRRAGESAAMQQAQQQVAAHYQDLHARGLC